MLSSYTTEALAEHRYVLILDCHSFSNTPYPCDINRDEDRPDISIGTDESHTPDELIKLTSGYFESVGYSVKLNSPFSGTIVPNGFENNNFNSVKNHIAELQKLLAQIIWDDSLKECCKSAL